MIAQLRNLDGILSKHNIHPKFHGEFRALIECGVRPGKELRTRLECVSNYKAALDEAMAELSEPLDHQFPSSFRFESLEVPLR
jgi:hypothetical protein